MKALLCFASAVCLSSYNFKIVIRAWNTCQWICEYAAIFFFVTLICLKIWIQSVNFYSRIKKLEKKHFLAFKNLGMFKNNGNFNLSSYAFSKVFRSTRILLCNFKICVNDYQLSIFLKKTMSIYLVTMRFLSIDVNF